MNILFTTCEGALTGATQSTRYLADGLAKRGHSIFVGCPRDSLLFKMLENSPAKRIAMPFRGRFDMKTLRIIRDLVRANSIEIINAQSSTDRYNSIFANRLYKLGAKVVHTRRQRPLSMGGALQRAFYVRNTAKIVVVSDELKRTLVKKGYPADHIEVIYNGMSPDFFAHADPSKTKALRRRFGLADDEVVVGCISRLKNQEQLVRAARHLSPNITLFFVGIEKGIFDGLAKRLDLPNRIIYAGIVPREEVTDYYRLFDLFVLPSTMDGFGLVLVEAMGLGVPVIGTHSQGIVDVLDHERNGLWFEDGDIEGLAERIELILNDAVTRERLVANGYIAAREVFTLEKTIDNYEVFFRRLIASDTDWA